MSRAIRGIVKVCLDAAITRENFYRSSFCASGECVMIAKQSDGGVLVRDSKDENNRTLHFTQSEWGAFVNGVKHNEFDVI
ncbi:MAG TPA: DUF397 domain-containing protein [Candidatus Saccharimonadales bacterium]|nr:DUF397 domain-containing protein [Candidatus Saccharimonadales bacterium]